MNMRKSFDEVFEDVTKYGTKVKTDEYHTNGAHIIIDQGQEQIAGYTDLEDGLFSSVPVLIFGDHTRIVKYVDQPFFLGADGVKVLRSRLTDADYRYLYYALKSIQIPNTGYNRHFKWLKDVEIEYPKNEEQRSIVITLDKISKIIDTRKAGLQKLDTLIKARFVEMFGDPNAKNVEHPVYEMDAIFDLQMGKTPDRSDSSCWGSGYDWITIRDIGSFNKYTGQTKEQITDYGVQKSGIKLVPQNTVIMSFKLSIGKTAITSKPSYTNEAIMAFIDKKTVALNTDYICELFSLKDWSEGINTAVMGNTLNKATLSKKTIQIPEINLQNKFSEFVKKVYKSKFVVQKALDEAQLLFDSLMQKWFG